MKNNSFREKKVIFFYTFFLLNLNKDAAQETLIKSNLIKFNIKEIEMIEDILKYSELIMKHLFKQLKFDKWSDINMLEKSILVNAVYEMIVLKISKKIVITEYIQITKKYGSSDDSYKFINSFLDK